MKRKFFVEDNVEIQFFFLQMRKRKFRVEEGKKINFIWVLIGY